MEVSGGAPGTGAGEGSLPGSLTTRDRMIADVFAKSYREYLELRPTHYRWTHLAPQALGILEEAQERNWSLEKIADYLHCEVEEAEGCLRRFIVTRKVNAEANEAARLRKALGEWVATQPGMEDLSESEKRQRGTEIAAIVANHLHAAALAGEDFMKLSRNLEAEAPAPQAPPRGTSAPDVPPKWGPQWKD